LNYFFNCFVSPSSFSIKLKKEKKRKRIQALAFTMNKVLREKERDTSR
jgi:hypothetical protein